MFEPIKTQRISDEIFRQIREAVIGGNFQAGERLPNERALAEQFATSRTSVREALRGLEQEGVIYIKKGVHGGIFVADVDHRLVSRSFQTLLQMRKVTINHIAEARLVFEPAAARLAAQRAKPEDFREMEEVIDNMTLIIEAGETPSSYDLIFHKLVARAAGNPILEMLADSMLGVASQVITELHPTIDVLRHVLKCHKDVFEAIRARDEDLAFSVMKEHIIDVQSRLIQQTSRNGRKAKLRATKGK